MNPFSKDDWIKFGKRRWWQLFLIQAVFLLAAGAFAAWSFYPSKTPDSASSSASTSIEAHQHGESAGATEESEPQWWTCAMHPQIRQPKPGNCPIYQVELVPIKPSAGCQRTLTIKPAIKQLMKLPQHSRPAVPTPQRLRLCSEGTPV